MIPSEQNEIQKIIYAISHDLGAPLRSVVNFTNLLEESYAEQLDEKAIKWLDFIKKDGRKAQMMVQGLLTYSRIITDERSPETLSLSSLCQQVVSGLGLKDLALEEAELSIHPLPNIQGIRDQWYLLFEALLINALTYRNKEEKTKIIVDYQVCDGQGVISVDDNGIGVPEKKFDDITLIFKRLQSDKKYPGLGMGLSYCKKIIERDGGGIDFEQSELGGLRVNCRINTEIVISESIV